MIEALNIIQNNLSISLSIILSIIAFLAGIIFYAKDIKVGLLSHMVLFGLVFAISYVNDWVWSIPLILFLSFVVLLTLSIFVFVDVLRNQGGLI